MRHRRSRHTRGFVTRVAVGAAASLAVVASGATGAMAEDVTPTDEADPSSQTTESGEIQDPTTPAETPVVPEDEAAAEVEGEVGPQAELAPDDGPGTDLEGGGDVEDVDEPPVAPVYGTQKIRIGVQQADGSYISPEASLVGTTMSITITGGVDELGEPLPDDTAECVVEGEGGDEGARYADCDVISGNDGALDLEAGQTATITPTVVPAGIVLAPTAQVIEPCLVAECGLPSGEYVDFEATGTPVAFSGATAAGQPVVVDVVAPLELAPDNAVTGVTVTSPPADGTAVVTGDLPPVTEEPVDTDEITAPVAAAAPSGTSRIVFTPSAGFVGTTTFGYAVATQHGTLTGVATITVAAAPVVTPPAGPTAPGAVTPGSVGTASPAASRVRNADGTLPSTGGPAAELLTLGAVLVVAGAGAMASRRRSGRELVG